MTSAVRDRYPASEAIAGFLAVCAIFLGALELFYRPFRLAPAALILALIATIMSRTQQRLVMLAFATIGICFVAGTALQVVTHHPLF